MPVITLPAPVGGLNARDPISAMPMGDAVELVNLVSKGLYVEVRRALRWLGAPATFSRIHSMHPYYGTAASKLLAGDDTTIKEISTGTPSTLGTGFSGEPWQSTAFQNKLILTGGGTAQSFDGTTLTALVTSGAAAADLWGCNTYKGRVYYWKKRDDSFWYAAAGAYQGALTEFPLDAQLSRGGYLVMMVSMTLDSGAGADDLAAFVFSTGEVLIYQGDDPGSASAWALVGKYTIPTPLGPRANIRIGGNAIVMTRQGYVNLNSIMRGETGGDGYMSDKVRNQVNLLVSAYCTDAEPADDQSDAVYCSKLNEVVFFHGRKLSGSVTGTSVDKIIGLLRYNLDSGTWYMAEPIADADPTLTYMHHAISEFNGGLYMATRRMLYGTNDSVQYSDETTGDEEIKFRCRCAYVNGNGGEMQITGVSVETSIGYSNLDDKLAGLSVGVDYSGAPSGNNTTSISSIDISQSPWKSVSKSGRSVAVMWKAQLVTSLTWYRSRIMTKNASPNR